MHLKGWKEIQLNKINNNNNNLKKKWNDNNYFVSFKNLLQSGSKKIITVH